MFKTLIVGNDHGGVEAKREILQFLRSRHIRVRDIGSNSRRIVRYPTYATEVAEGVLSGRYDGGILICSTGIGMSIAANRYPGIRASVCTTHLMAVRTREHNNSNVLCLGGKTTGIFELLDIVDAWLSSEYIGGRHSISLDMIKGIEQSLVEKARGGL